MFEAKRPLISIAPMLDITNVYFRYFMRLITSEATLYTQMIHCNAILYTDKGYKQILKFNQVEHPVVLQLGGSDPDLLGKSSKLIQQMGYDQINLNVGCPSPRVQKGSFGACLMKQPKIVDQCLNKMLNSVKIPCTIKCRLGVDQFQSYDFIKKFVETTNNSNSVNHYIIHARKAYLKGLNPNQNRNIPPLNYQYVYKLKKDFPEMNFTLNGGIKTLNQAKSLLEQQNIYGCMIGRTAYMNPWQLSSLDKVIYNKESKNYNRKEILQLYSQYIDQVLEKQPKLCRSMLIKPIINLFSGENHNLKYRQFLSELKIIKKYEVFSDMIKDAVSILEQNNKQALYERKFDKIKQKI